MTGAGETADGGGAGAGDCSYAEVLGAAQEVLSCPELLGLMEQMARDDLEGDEFEDHYTDALADVIKAKREGHAPPQAPAAQSLSGEVVDLMAALEASVKKAQASRGQRGDADVH